MNTSFSVSKVAVASMVVLSGLGLIGAFVFADNTQTNPMSLSINSAGSVHLSGIVSGISGSMIAVSSWGGTWSVDTVNAKFLPPNAATLSQIKIGDDVGIQGTISSGMSLAASTITDKSVYTVKRMDGTIGNINPAAGTFTLSVQNMGNVSIVTTSDTKVLLNGNTASLSSLSNGSAVTVIGFFNVNTNTLTAKTISVPQLAQPKNSHGENKNAVQAKANLFGKLCAFLHIH